jgi:hypothetical protein
VTSISPAIDNELVQQWIANGSLSKGEPTLRALPEVSLLSERIHI